MGPSRARRKATYMSKDLRPEKAWHWASTRPRTSRPRKRRPKPRRSAIKMRLRRLKVREPLLIKLRKVTVTRSARSTGRRKRIRRRNATLEKRRRSTARSRIKLMKLWCSTIPQLSKTTSRTWSARSATRRRRCARRRPTHRRRRRRRGPRMRVYGRGDGVVARPQ